MIDSTAATTVAGFVRKQRRRGARVFITGAPDPVRRELLSHGVQEPEVDFRANVAVALQECRSAPPPAPGSAFGPPSAP